jgi:hypothetical protein
LSEQDLRYYEAALDPQIVAVAIDKASNEEQLSSLERSQLRRRQGMNFRIFEHAYYLHRAGALDVREWGRYQRIIRNNICGNEFAIEMWSRTGPSWDEEFQSIVEEEKRKCAK